ncbi:MAG: hypothetical protein PHY54_03740 [Methylococcales bacterium]|nr:hypothetical protein [Methylococcales bacterium]
MFLDFRFYFAKKTIDAEKATAKIKGVVVPFQTKLELAVGRAGKLNPALKSSNKTSAAGPVSAAMLKQ